MQKVKSDSRKLHCRNGRNDSSQLQLASPKLQRRNLLTKCLLFDMMNKSRSAKLEIAEDGSEEKQEREGMYVKHCENGVFSQLNKGWGRFRYRVFRKEKSRQESALRSAAWPLMHLPYVMLCILYISTDEERSMTAGSCFLFCVVLTGESKMPEIVWSFPGVFQGIHAIVPSGRCAWFFVIGFRCQKMPWINCEGTGAFYNRKWCRNNAMWHDTKKGVSS